MVIKRTELKTPTEAIDEIVHFLSHRLILVDASEQDRQLFCLIYGIKPLHFLQIGNKIVMIIPLTYSMIQLCSDQTVPDNGTQPVLYQIQFSTIDRQFHARILCFPKTAVKSILASWVTIGKIPDYPVAK